MALQNYNFSLDSFTITNTRSRHVDTDYVSTSLAVPGHATMAKTRRMGDLNNGTYATGLGFENVPIDDNEVVTFTYLIVNNGHSDPGVVEQKLQDAASALASKAAQAAAEAIGTGIGAAIGASIGTAVVPIIGSALGALAGWMVSEIGNFLFANCDGGVAAGVHVFKGSQLRGGTAGGGAVQGLDHNPGTDSPDACGSNSRYYVRWTIHNVAGTSRSETPMVGIWTVPSHEQTAVWGWARSDFDAKANEMAAAGFRPVSITTGVGSDGGNYWNGIWTRDGVPYEYVYGWARPDFDAKGAALASAGYRPVMVNSIAESNGGGWNGIWVKDGVASNWVWGWAISDFNKHVDDMQAQGYRPIMINTNTGSGGQSWNGIWVKDGVVSNWAYGFARADFDRTSTDMKNQGFRPLMVSAIPSASGDGYNGIWVKDGAAWNAVWGWARQDFDKHAQEMQAQGFALNCLE